MPLQAVILAGGKGTRLASRLNGRPKPLVDVIGTPLLERQIEALKSGGVNDVVLLVSHEAEQIRDFCAARSNFGLERLRLIEDGVPRGTSGAVLACLDELAGRFLVVYGDTLFNVDFAYFITEHERAGADATLFLHPNDHPFDSDLVSVGEDGMVDGFHPKPRAPDVLVPNLVNAALYLMERRTLDRWRDFPTPSDFGANLFPAMLAAGARLKGYSSFEYIKDIGTPARLDKAKRDLASGVLQRAIRSRPQTCVFLDRDGTLNELRGYVRKPEELIMLRGAAEAVRRFNTAEHRVALITNQPVIARGECTPAQLRQIHAKLDQDLSRAGAFIDRTYYCPHHPDSGFPGEIAELKVRCSCRKPGAGMLIKAMRDLNTAANQSWMVGDSTSDILAGKRAGLRTLLLGTGEGGRDGKYAVLPDFISPNLTSAAAFILGVYPRIAFVAADITKDIQRGTLVLVGGAARSGKSTLSKALSEELTAKGRSNFILQLDRWIRPLNGRRPGLIGRFDLEGVSQALAAWLRNGSAHITMPFYDRHAQRQIRGEEVHIAADDILILEGVPALLLSMETPRAIKRFHVRSAEAQRRERVVADLVARGIESTDQAEATYEARLRDEMPLVEQAASSADKQIDLDDCYSDVEFANDH